ncbi:unnamed protein product (macronuclear) [Paramecium tetraurelia]|uniref:Uncharacterized protein n=1 Tax=Paramecium tetraurelia TaxID=5888 RepID=A0EIF7_PARTE|nr:uncharacterized protein GSPATT00027427001 [Paramecium tetraurelia]CAK95098.1 unnamed protein product [Paramecium tetraurelia]|eukprot:XP_001462471.1 hypothetical protein (macronuclear) [Paramecium tetraurelia strain d4-2]
MNRSYYNKSNSNLTPGKAKSQHVTQIQLNISKYIRDSSNENNKRGDNLLNTLIQQSQQAIQSARQFSVDRPIKTSPIESSPHIQKKMISTSQNLQLRKSTDQQQRSSAQFDRLLNENTSLLMRIQELEQKVRNQCQQCSNQSNKRSQENVLKITHQNKGDIDVFLQSHHCNENENRILKELINRQSSIMHIPSVIQTLSLIK